MITTKIQIKPHLVEYAYGKFNDHSREPIQFPDNLDVYHTIWDLLERRPVNCRVDIGNLEIALPDRRTGKNPESFNYLGQRSHDIIGRKIEVKMFAELHDELDEQKHLFGIDYIDTVHSFMLRYDIISISEDALLKNYYRWRDLVRKRKLRRSYNMKSR